MDETELDAPKTPWGKRIGIFFGVLLVLLVIAYFVGTSSAFVKGVILPKVGSSMNARITAGDVSVSPFSQLHVRQLRVETTGAEPLLTAEEVRVRYSLMDILKGNIKVDEVTLNSPVITLVQEPDGTSNLDPITKGGSKSTTAKKEPTRLSVQNVSLKNGTVRQIQKTKEGLTTTELKNLTVALDRLGNGQTGKLQLSSAFSVDQRQGATNSALAGDFSGGYDVALNQELLPDTLKGSSKFTIARAEGTFKDLAQFSGSLDADLTPKEIRQLALRFTRANQPLGQVRVSGPMDIDKKEGTLMVEVNNIDKNVLALATSGKGYDLGNTQINSTNQVTIAQGGSFISSTGVVAGTTITFTQGALKTPEMNLNVDYQVAVNNKEKSALLQRLNLTGLSGGKPFLLSSLDRQMVLSWGEQAKGNRDAALNLILTNFNIGDWRAILGTNLNTGVANATVALVSQQDGKLLNTDLKARVDGLSAQFGSNRLDNATVTLESTGTVEQLKTVNLTRYAFALQQANAPVLQASGTARYVLESKDTTAQVLLEGALPRLLTLASVPDANAKTGTLRATAQYNEANGKKTAVGNVTVADYTGQYAKYSFTNLTAAIEYNIDTTTRELTLNRMALALNQGFNRGGTVEVKGKYNLETKGGQFTFSTTDLNQNTFAPILAPSLGDNRLVSIVMNASGEARLDPQGESALKAQVKIANWVVDDPAGKLPKTPLAVDMNIDGSMAKEVLDLRQFLVQLTETPRARNALQLQAKLDLSKTNPAPSTLTLSSESFDLTPYYDMFAGKETATSEKPSASPAPSVAAAEQKEPEPMQLPFKDLTANLKIDRLFLREIAISNWVGKITMRSNVLELNPFQLQLNGGPVNMSGKVDVGRPGYNYDLAFKASTVPLAPLANSFSSKSNSLEGTFIADAAIRGAGVTGPNLRRNLSGSTSVNLTNLNYQVVGPKLRRILVPISLALRVPELTETPINWVSAQTDIGNGAVNLKHLGVESEAFYAESMGPITLADIITNSTLNLPVDLSLRRSLAQKTGLIAPGDTTTNKYAKLPRFVTIKGTVGMPETDINKLAIAGLLARGAAAFGLGDAKTEQALGTVGSLLTGQGKTAGGTNTTPAGNIAQTIGGLLGGKAATNAPAAAATNAPDTKTVVTNAVQNALDSLLRPRKKN